MSCRRQFLKLAGLEAASAVLGRAADPTLGLIFASATARLPPDASGIRCVIEGIGAGSSLPESFDTLASRIAPAVQKLANAGAQAIVLMSPPLSFYPGARFNQNLSRSFPGGPAFLTASTAIVEGLRAVRARRLAVATAYTEEVSLHLQGFLEESGFEVVVVKSLGIDRFEERPPLLSMSAEELFDFSARVRESRPEADALLLAYASLPTRDLIVPLEKRCQIPVISATLQALKAGQAAAN
jgi:arylmalonate decarboxylase